MNKRKTIGMIIFSCILVLFLKFPQISEYCFQKRIDKLIESEQYQRAYDILSKREIQDLNHEYINLLKCEIALQHSSASMRIDELILSNNVESLQYLVDNMGVGLSNYLIRIDNAIEGLVYDEELKGILAEYQYQSGNIERAIELKDITEVDFVFMQYLNEQGDFYKFLKYYGRVPREHKNLYISFMSSSLFSQIFQYQTLTGSIEFVDKVSEEDLSEEVMRGIGIFYSFLSLYELDDITKQNYYDVMNHEFFLNNPYSKFYNSLFLLGDQKKFNQGLKDLQENEDYFDLLDRDELVYVATHNTQVFNLGHVTKGEILTIEDPTGGVKYYDLVNDQYLDLDQNLRIVDVSTNRDYLIMRGFEEGNIHYYLADSQLNSITILDENMVFLFWIDNEYFSYVYADDSSNKMMSYHAPTQEIARYRGGARYGLNFTPPIPNSRVLSMDNQIYTVIEPKKYINGLHDIPSYYRYYTIRSLDDHEVLHRLEMNFMFLGSSDHYIYGTKWGGVNKLVKMDKKTGDIIELPFYSIVNGQPELHYIDGMIFYNEFDHELK